MTTEQPTTPKETKDATIKPVVDPKPIQTSYDENKEIKELLNEWIKMLPK